MEKKIMGGKFSVIGVAKSPPDYLTHIFSSTQLSDTHRNYSVGKKRQDSLISY